MEMSIQIAVSDPLPVFRRGIMATLGEAGFRPEAPEDLLAWIRQENRRVVLLTLESVEDWSLLAQLHEANADVLVVAVMADTDVRAYVQAVVTGAVAAVPRDAPPELVRQVFEAAVAGRSVLPVEVVRALASAGTRPTPDGGDAPSAREVDWLRELARGATVAKLAERAGYSERAMFRLLRQMYVRIGARNRTEALIQAHGRGWL
jgi:DNA-binding NarL/FixJ family response regulator